MASVKDWLRAADPRRKLVTREESVRAARLGAVGLLISAGSGLVSALDMHLRPQVYVELMQRQFEAQAAADPATADLTLSLLPTMIPVMMWSMVGASGLYLVLAIVQWFKTTTLIPLIMLMLAALGIAMNLPTLLSGQAAATLHLFPLWRIALGWVFSAAILLMLWAGFRGGDRLERLKRAERKAARAAG